MSKVLDGCAFFFSDVGLGRFGVGESLGDFESDVVSCCLHEESEFRFNMLDDLRERDFLRSHSKVQAQR